MSARGHGLDGREAARFWPALTAEALRPVVARYPALGAVREVAWRSPRPFAASGLVECAAARVFVKRHDPRVRDEADVREEHCFIAYLRARGAPVPAVLPNDAGDTVTAEHGLVYEVHALGAGEDCYRDAHSWTPVRSDGEARAAGAALARLHGAARGYDAPARRTALVVAGDAILRAADPMAALAGWAERRGGLGGCDWRRDFRNVLARPLAAWRPYAQACPPAWVHGDFHVSNLLWANGAVASILDFGLCNRASALFDLATAIERNAIAWLDLTTTNAVIGHAGRARAMLAGYAGVRPLAPEQMAALRCLLPVVHVDFALSELAYFSEVTKSKEHANQAYQGFLLDHTTWFATKEGRIFLELL